MPMGSSNEVGFDGEIVADEIGREFIVGQDAADAGCRNEDVLGLFEGEKRFGGLRVSQVEFGVSAGDEVCVAGCDQCAAQGGTDQTAVAGDVEAGVGDILDPENLRFKSTTGGTMPRLIVVPRQFT
jgi:hypothetical protein